MLKKSSDEFRGTVVSHVEPDQTIRGVQPIAAEKILVETEEGGSRQMVQNRNEILVARAQSADLHADNSDVNSPATQPRALVFGQVFVEHQHEIP